MLQAWFNQKGKFRLHRLTHMLMESQVKLTCKACLALSKSLVVPKLIWLNVADTLGKSTIAIVVAKLIMLTHTHLYLELVRWMS